MKKLSKIQESLFSDVVARGEGRAVRMEDFNKFDEPFKKIKNAELIDSNDPRHNTLWTLFNFGSDSIDKPGWYMDANDMKELKEYLKDTDYCIPTSGDWYELLMHNYFELKKLGQYHTFHIIDSNFYLPRFGYISAYNIEHGDENKVTLPPHNIGEPYAFAYDCGFGYEMINFLKSHMENTIHTIPQQDITDKVQVRLIKRIHK